MLDGLQPTRPVTALRQINRQVVEAHRQVGGVGGKVLRRQIFIDIHRLLDGLQPARPVAALRQTNRQVVETPCQVGGVGGKVLRRQLFMDSHRPLNRLQTTCPVTALRQTNRQDVEQTRLLLRCLCRPGQPLPHRKRQWQQGSFQIASAQPLIEATATGEIIRHGLEECLPRPRQRQPVTGVIHEAAETGGGLFNIVAYIEGGVEPLARQLIVALEQLRQQGSGEQVGLRIGHPACPVALSRLPQG